MLDIVVRAGQAKRVVLKGKEKSTQAVTTPSHINQAQIQYYAMCKVACSVGVLSILFTSENSLHNL
jgi:hypothetical protein